MVSKFSQLALLLCMTGAAYAVPPPVIYYTDITDGPNTGGENGNGAILTVCGQWFGATQGTSKITIGGGTPAVYLQWGANNTGNCNKGGRRTEDSITVAIGSFAASGAVIVTVNGVMSNTDKSFTVNTWSTTQNRIFSEDSVNGNDSNNGQFLSDPLTLPGVKGPWKTIRHTKALIRPGDKVYFGTASNNYQSEFDVDVCGGSGGATIVLTTSPCGGGGVAVQNGTATQHISFIGYPRAVATIGCPTVSCPLISFLSTAHSIQHWDLISLTAVPGQCTISGTPTPLHCTSTPASTGAWGGIRLGGSGGLVPDGPGDVRIINNDLQCPNGNTPNIGCLGLTTNTVTHTVGVISLFIFGNHIHNYTDYATDTTVGWRHANGVYLGYGSNEIDFGWNDLDGSAGYSSLGLHIHPSAIGSTNGFPLYGIHIHDSILHDTPAGNDLSLFDPSIDVVEMFNNLYVHQGDCMDYPGAAPIGQPGGWKQGFRRNGAHSFGQPGWDENWKPMHGNLHIFNNTYLDIANCPGFGADGWISMVPPTMPATATSPAIRPPADFTICTGVVGSPCSLHQAGTLPAASPTYAADNVAFEVSLGSIFLASIADDGAGNLLQGGVAVGTFNYGTGAYNFTLTGAPLAATAIIKYRTIYGYHVVVQNSIIWMRATSPSPYLGQPGVSKLLVNNRLSGDHNLFFTVTGQPTPSQFTSPIGTNSDPQFVATGAIGNIPFNGDLHLQASSPARGACGVGPTRDFDGIVRTAPYDCGAFVFQPASGGGGGGGSVVNGVVISATVNN